MNNREKELLRRLAAEHMEAASAPENLGKIALWRGLNRGEMARPMVLIDQLPWHELEKTGELDCECAPGLLRDLEWRLRAGLYRHRHFPVDFVLEPFVSVPMAAHNSGHGLSPAEETILQAQGGISAHSYTPVLSGFEDLEKIKPCAVTHDAEETARRFELCSDIFAGIAPVRMRGLEFHLGPWDTLTTLMGVENIYMDLIDRPEFLLAAMERMTDGIVSAIEQADALGVHDAFSTVTHCSHTFTDELMPGFETKNAPLAKNCWAFGLAQLFSSVSPEVTAEFELPFISRMAERFGMVYYGCCDRLDDRLDLVRRIPNVKKVSCSPWSERNAFAERLGPELVMSVKPNPAFLAEGGFDGEHIEKDLAEYCALAKRHGVNMEFILKDVSTVQNRPGRVDEWAKIAMGVVESF